MKKTTQNNRGIKVKCLGCEYVCTGQYGQTYKAVYFKFKNRLLVWYTTVLSKHTQKEKYVKNKNYHITFDELNEITNNIEQKDFINRIVNVRTIEA